MLGAAQKLHLEQTLRNSNASALVLVNPSIWLSDQAGGDNSIDSWGRFRTEREELVQILGDTGWLDRMVMLQFDKHALSISSGPANPWGGFPVFMAASMDSHHATVPELSYDQGQSPGRQRYGTVRVHDSGHTIALQFTGYVMDQVWRTYTGYANVEPHVIGLNYAAGQVFEPFDPTDDDQRTANDITAERRGGAGERAQDDTGPMGVDTVGRYSRSETVNVVDDDHLGDQAGWMLHEGTVDAARFPRINQILTNPRMEHLRRGLARLDAGDGLTVDNPPPWLPPEQIGTVVEGYDERINTHEWETEYHTSPARIWEVGRVAPRIILNPNHDFETGVHGWEVTAFGVDPVHDVSHSYRGLSCLQVTPGAGSTGTTLRTRLDDSPRAYAGVEYHFSVWVWSAQGIQMYMSAEWLDADGETLGSPLLTPISSVPSGEWISMVGSAVAPQGSYRVRWNIRQTGDITPADVMRVDEAVISHGVVSDPSSPNRADTSGSYTGHDLSTEDTQVLVHTALGEDSGQRWINSVGPSVTHHHEFPFDVRMGGEVVRVTDSRSCGWDLFRSGRASGSWGTSDSGHEWTATTTAPTVVGTDTENQFGFMRLTSSTNTPRFQALGLDFEVADCDVVWSARTNQASTGSAQLPSLLMRRVDNNNYYRLRIHLNTTGSVSLSVTRGVNMIGDPVVLPPTIAYTPGPELDDRIMVRTRIIGHRVLGRAWRADHWEPSHWQIDRTIEEDPIEQGGFGFSASTFASYTGVDPEMRFRLEEVVAPQVFTVERSINTVVKEHPAGTALSLDRPAVLGL